MDAGLVLVPFSTQLLAAAVALQLVAFVAVLWRGLFGLPQLSTRRPRWPFIPLLLGTAAGVWYAALQRDLVMGAAQGLALFIGFCLIRSTRGELPAEGAPQGTRRERREAQRQAKRKGKGPADG